MATRYLTLPPFILQNKIGRNEIIKVVSEETTATVIEETPETIVLVDLNGKRIYIHKKDTHIQDAEEYVLTTDREPRIDKILENKQKLHWLRHPNIGHNADQIIQSWHNGVFLREETAIDPGLRTPQLGAIYAALAHWSTSNSIATIVMPTGTGKTETMLSLLLLKKCERLLVTVPSDALRGQLASKFETLGLLRTFNIASPTVETPIVGILQERFETEELLRDFIKACNVIVTTMAHISGYSDRLQKCFAELCPYYFIDEAHHTTAKTWIEFIKRFENSRVLQFTATPFRNDGAKLNGQIIFNYPLKLAQAEHYFTQIYFNPVFEIDSNLSDYRIAEKAIELLETQRKSGFDKQVIMARCENKARAREVYKIYSTLYSQYNPVIVFSGAGLTTKDRREAIAKLQSGTAKIVVCVDMLGEGFDLPTLKIAALHDIKKSLTVTLQLIGRFTRTKYDENLGPAAFVANIADIFVGEELERLYAQDADWNELLPELSMAAINQEVEFSELIKGFTIPNDIKIPLQNLRPALSTVIYRNPKASWNYGTYQSGLSLNADDRSWSFVNTEENVLIIVIARKQAIDWGNIQDIENVIWDLLVVINDVDNKLLYINGSDNNGLYTSLAEAIIGEKTPIIRHSDPFKAFYNIKRVRLQNVGLKQIIGKNIRFRMSVGSDVAEALSIAEKSSGQKAFVVGSGYENGNKVTLGCSYKGRVWTLLTDNIQSLIAWCKHIGSKVINPDINGDELLKETLVPQIISSLPQKNCVWVDWNEEIYNFSETKIEFLMSGHTYYLYDTTITLNYEKSNSTSIVICIEFTTQTDGSPKNCEVIMTVGEDNGVAYSKYHLQNDHVPLTVRIGRKELTIEQFFQQYEPSIWFVDGSYMCGNEYIELKQAPGIYPIESIEAWDWSGVDIRKESQGVGNVQTDSIQYHVIQKLLPNNYDIIYDDDNAGEIADIVALKETVDSIHVDLFHLKFAKEGIVSQQIENLYEVCGQAQKSVHWKFRDSKDLFRHLYKRMIKKDNGQSGSRIILGDINELQRLESLSRVKLPLKFKITIVQPGMSATKSTVAQRTLLSVTEQYLMDVANIPLNVIANQN